MRALPLLLLALVGLPAAGCKWSEFDDIEGDTWVAATEKPENGSTSWAIAIAPGKRTPGVGGTLAVFGSNEPIYNEVLYSETGGASIGPAVLEFEDLGWGTFAPEPIVLHNPDEGSDELALITQPGAQSVLFYGTQNQFDYRELTTSTAIDAATYINPAPSATTPAQVASIDESVLFAVNRNGDLETCNLADAGGPVIGRGLAAVRPTGAADDLLAVWGDDGIVRLYNSDVFLGDGGVTCATGTALAEVQTFDAGFAPEKGSILDFRGTGVFGRDYLLLVGHDGQRTFLRLLQVGAGNVIAAIGEGVMTDRAASATILALPNNGGTFAVLGIPSLKIDNVEVGQVKLYELAQATGVEDDTALVLNDAQPEDGQVFGRSVAAIPFNDGMVLAVGADNEVFLYFQTELYGETRKGR